MRWNVVCNIIKRGHGFIFPLLKNHLWQRKVQQDIPRIFFLLIEDEKNQDGQIQTLVVYTLNAMKGHTM